jgi:hypothetical protein
MPPPDDHAHRIGRLEDRVGELERRDRQRASDWRSERESLLDAVKRFVDKAMTAALEPFQSLVPDVAQLKATNAKQLELLEAAEERGRRKQREDDDERRRKDAALALEHKKIDVEVRRVDVEVHKADTQLETAHVDARVRRVKIIAGLIVSIVSLLAGLFGAAAASHH